MPAQLYISKSLFLSLLLFGCSVRIEKEIPGIFTPGISSGLEIWNDLIYCVLIELICSSLGVKLRAGVHLIS